MIVYFFTKFLHFSVPYGILNYLQVKYASLGRFIAALQIRKG